MTGTFQRHPLPDGAGKRLETVRALALQVAEPEFLAKIAIYAAEKGHMKDLPVTLLAVLSRHFQSDGFAGAFPRA